MPNYRDVTVWLMLTSALGSLWFFFTEPFDRLVLLNTIGLGFSASLIAVPTGLLLARTSLPQDRLARATFVLILATAFIPLVFQVSFWDAAFGKLGWLTATSTGQNKPLLSGWMAASWIHATALIPQIALIFLAVFWTGEQVHEEQALLECSPTRVFWTITLPRIVPVAVLCVVWCVIHCAREIAATDIYQVGTLAEQVYLGFSLGQFDSFMGNWTNDELAAASSLGIWTQILSTAWLVASAAILFARFLGGQHESADRKPRTPALAGNTRKRNWLASVTAVAACGVLTLLPIYNLIARASFHVARVDGTPRPGYSFGQFCEAIQLAAVRYVPQTQWSILVAGGCALVTIVIAAAIAWNAKTSRRFRPLAVVITSICFALPGPIIGSLIARTMTSLDTPAINFLFDRTLFAPIVAAMIVCLPIAITLCYFIFDSVAIDTQQHAATEGAGRTTTFFSLGIAGNRLPLAGVLILTFVLAYGELAASQMVLPPGVETVPRLTLGLMHSGVNEMTAALTIINIVAIVLISLCGWWLVGLKSRNGQQQ